MPTTITSAGVTFTDTTTLTSANGVPSALKLTTARTINGVSFDGTGNITIPATSISGANVAKAWVNFNGANPSVINGTSFNVSSVTWNAAGDYTINFPAGVLADTNYSVSGMSMSYGIGNSSGASSIGIIPSTNGGTTPLLKTTTQLRINVGNPQNGATINSGNVSIQIFGN